MSKQWESSQIFCLIEQQIEAGTRLSLYCVEIPANYSDSAKYGGHGGLIEEAEKWSKDTIEKLGLYKPFYRAIDWNKSNAHKLGVYEMPNEKLQYYQDLLKNSVESLRNFRDRLKCLVEASE